MDLGDLVRIFVSVIYFGYGAWFGILVAKDMECPLVDAITIGVISALTWPIWYGICLYQDLKRSRIIP